MSVFFGAMIFISRAQAFRNLPPEICRLRQDADRWLCLAAADRQRGRRRSRSSALYRLTPLGREMLAAGAKAAAAELSGIRVGRTFVICHILSGVLAGIAAMMVVARTGAAIPSMAGDLGQDWLLPAFLGPVLGGTAAGGRARLGARRVPRGGAGQRADQRIAAIPQSASSGCSPASALLLLLGRADRLGRRSLLAWGASRGDGDASALLRTDWFGPLAIVVAGVDRHQRPRPVVPVAVQHPDPAARPRRSIA